jgi:hypothetical protein
MQFVRCRGRPAGFRAGAPLVALLAGLALFGFCPASHAGIIGTDSGNSLPSNLTGTNNHSTGNDRVDGTFNFAVYKNGGGTGNDVFGTGFSNFDTSGVTKFNSKSTTGGPSASAGLDTTAKYLYVFQVSNNGIGRQLFNAIIPLAAGKITSYGVLINGTTPLGFSDNRGLVTGQQLESRGANNLGPETFGPGLTTTPQLTGFTQHAPANLIGSNVALYNPMVTTDSNAYRKIGLDLQAGELIADFGTGGLVNLATSELFYFTSNSPPTFGSGGLVNSAFPPTAFGAVPTVVPVPPSVILCGLGIMALGLVQGLRRWRMGVLAA